MTSDPTNASLEPKRGRGRPKGAKNKVIRHAKLGIHHFAFLRASIQGHPLDQAWQRYMAACDPNSDLRHVKTQREMLLSNLLHLGQQLNQSLEGPKKITDLLQLLRKAPEAAEVVAKPSLEEFAASKGWDLDVMSEADLQQEYIEHFGVDRPLEEGETKPAVEAKIAAQVRALNHLETLMVRRLELSDSLDMWMHAKSVGQLRGVGVGTVGSLIEFINLHGYNWFRQVRGFGAARAIAIVSWIKDEAQLAGRPLLHSALSPPGRIGDSATRDLVLKPVFAIVPLDQLDVPPNLSGAGGGTFRSMMGNTLGASNDLEAINAWLNFKKDQPHTYRSYRKEVERFYLWTLHVQRKPLSSLTSPNCQQYSDFLRALPSSWIRPPTARRAHDSRWRPFNGQLSPASIRQALVIVNSMFIGLCKAGYLVANAMAVVNKAVRVTHSNIDINRSLTQAEWSFAMSMVDRAVDEEPNANAYSALDTLERRDEPMKQARLDARAKAHRRLRAILHLLSATGLRLDELAKAKWGDLETILVDGEVARVLTVVGKRDKRRVVPVPEHAFAILLKHQDDISTAEFASGNKGLPLIGIVDDLKETLHKEKAATALLPTRTTKAGNPGEEPVRTSDAPPPLSNSGIYKVLRRFFRRLAKVAEPPIDAEHLSRASTHWLRHTFGAHSAAADMPLEILQQTLGHTSIATTTIYVTTERDRMIRESRKADAIRNGQP